MKKLFLSFLALSLCGTTSLCGATRGKITINKTTATVASENSWSGNGTIKNSVNLDGYIQYTGVKNNATLQVNNDGKITGARVYESINQSGPSTISGTNVWIDSVKFNYNTSTTGVLCSSKDTVDGVVPGKSGTIYESGTMYKVDAASFSFYSGRTSTSKSNGRCDITNWTVVYYKLPSQIKLAENITVAVGDTFQIGQVCPADAYCVWSSADESKIKVDQNGVIMALAVTSTPVEIKVVSKNDIEKICSVKVVASTGGDSWTETFSNAGYLTSNTTKDIVGDSAVYNWKFTTIRRENKEASKIDGQQAINLRYDGTTSGGSVASDGNFEGGIKSVSFKWAPMNGVNENHFKVNIGDTTYEFYSEKLAYQSVSYRFKREVGIQSNTSFSISIDTLRTPQQSYQFIGPITITPYLLYTTKSAEAYSSAGTYTNESLINNTGETPSYSLSCGTDTAEIDANGAVTIKKSAVVIVTARWENVSTTYALKMHAKPAPVITFADQNVNMNQTPFVPEPTAAPAGIGTPSYSSSDKSVVKVDATTGQLTIVGEGSAVIYIHYTEGTDYAETDVQYNVTVTDPMEDAIVENFKDTTWGAETIPHTFVSALAEWEYQYARRRYSGTGDFDTLQNGAHATWLNYYDTAHLTTTDVLEGGIKRVSFLWNRAHNNDRIVEFAVSAGAELQTKDTVTKATTGSVIRLVPDVVYNHNFFVKGNSKLSINHTGAQDGNKQSRIYIGDIKITPYIFYMCKDTTIQVQDYVVNTFTNDKFINNIGAEGSISYSIEDAESKTTIAEILDANSSAVTIHGAGTVKVIATWSEGATTSYQLKVTDGATNMESVQHTQSEVRKALINDHIYILRDARMYDLQGNEQK